MSNVATIERPSAPSIIAAMADRYGMAPAAFEATLRATVVPTECTREQFAAFLLVAHEYGLNPILKEIYAFPAKGGGIQPVVGIDGWVKLMNEHPMMDGIEYEDHLDDKRALVAVTARIYRKDRSRPMSITEYMSECRRSTDPWKQWPHRMLRHKATIQAVRYAFGYASIPDADEAEMLGADVRSMRDVSPSPPSPPPAAGLIAAAAHDADTGELHTDEIYDDPATPPEAGARQPPAAEGAGGNAAEPSATVAPSPPPASEAGDATTVRPRPLTPDEKRKLKTFADALASANTPGSVDRGAGRFWADNKIEDEASPLALAANEIAAAHLSRTRGDSSPADADHAVRKVLA